MAFTHVGGSTATNSGDTSVDISLPSGTAAGDLLILNAGAASGTKYAVPADWSRIMSIADTGGNDKSGMACWKIAEAADITAGSFTITTPTTGQAALALSAFRPEGYIYPVTARGYWDSDFGSNSSPGVIAKAGDLAVATVAVNYPSDTIAAAGAGWSDSAAVNTGTSLNHMGVCTSYVLAASAGVAQTSFSNIPATSEAVTGGVIFEDYVPAASDGFIYRGYKEATSGGTTLTIIHHPLLAVGDLMVVVIGQNDDQTAVTAGAWTTITSAMNADGNDNKIFVGYKIADASDVSAGSTSFTVEGGEATAGQIMVFDTRGGTVTYEGKATDLYISGVDGSTYTSNARTPTAGNLVIGGVEIAAGDLYYYDNAAGPWYYGGTAGTGTGYGQIGTMAVFDTSSAAVSRTFTYQGGNSTGDGYLVLAEFSSTGSGGGTEYDETPTEAVGVTDTVTAAKTITVTITDTVGVTDTVSDDTATAHTATPVEAVGITDVVAAALAAARTVTDPVAVTDAVAAVLAAARAVSEPIGVTDTVTASKSITVTITEPVSVTDTAAGNEDDAEAVTDPVGVTDDVGVTVQRQRAPVETVGVTDSLDTAKLVGVEATDAVAVADTVVRAVAAARSVTDPVGVTDVVEVVKSIVVSIVESVGVLDPVNTQRIKVVEITEPVGVTDPVSRTRTVTVTVTEPVSVADVVDRARQASVTITEAVGVTDVFAFAESTILFWRRRGTYFNPDGVSYVADPVGYDPHESGDPPPTW